MLHVYFQRLMQVNFLAVLSTGFISSIGSQVMNSLFSQVCLQPLFICAPLLSHWALLSVFLISFSSPVTCYFLSSVLPSGSLTCFRASSLSLLFHTFLYHFDFLSCNMHSFKSSIFSSNQCLFADVLCYLVYSACTNFVLVLECEQPLFLSFPFSGSVSFRYLHFFLFLPWTRFCPKMLC